MLKKVGSVLTLVHVMVVVSPSWRVAPPAGEVRRMAEASCATVRARRNKERILLVVWRVVCTRQE